MKLPIGQSDFQTIIDNSYYFVDKSLFIKEIIDDTEVILITRPRRFGKTLNTSMLKYFFSEEVNGLSTKGLFDNLKISNVNNQIAKHQGQHPVIFLTFKDIKESNFEKTYESFGKQISKLYTEYQFLLDSPKIYDHEKKVYQSILEQRATLANITASLRDLIEYLFRYYDKKPVVLIDEYDTPIQAGYLNDYYDDIVGLFRNFFSAALKDNPYLFKSVLTGILRVSRESLFSGLNNLKSYSMLHPKYGAYFGFTENEVSELLSKAGLQSTADEVKKWYNGYQIGDYILYNPWSIVNYIQDKALKPYWVNTSDNTLIKNLLLKSSTAFKEQFEVLLQDDSIERLIDENFVFPDLRKNNESAVWSLMLMAGYLKVISYQETNRGSLCRLAIPNQEIRNLYQRIIEQWLSNGYGIEWYVQFLDHLLTGDMVAFERDLRHIMEQTVSVHDVAREPEAFYHGLMIGLTASLHGHNNYEIRSNRESGYGRYDYLIISRDLEKLTIMLEFKKIDFSESKKDEEEVIKILNKKALTALKQADTQGYMAEAKQRGIKKILKIGIAFSGKKFGIAYEKFE